MKDFSSRYCNEPFECHEIANRESWLEMRKQDITASVAGAIIGNHPYQTPFSLWAQKSGQVSENQEENEAMKRGRLLEPVALQMLMEDQPSWCVSAAHHYYRDPEIRLGATPDAFAFDPIRRGFGVVQVKTVVASAFLRNWRSGDDVELTVPPWIEVQTQLEMHLSGASWAVVAVLVIEPRYGGLGLHVIDVEPNDYMIERLKQEAAKFWDSVRLKQPPDVDYSRDTEVIHSLDGIGTGEPIDLSDWNEGPELAEEDRRLTDGIANATQRRREIKAQVLMKMGNASLAMWRGQEFITVKNVFRKGYEAKASSYKDIRFKHMEDDL